MKKFRKTIVSVLTAAMVMTSAFTPSIPAAASESETAVETAGTEAETSAAETPAAETVTEQTTAETTTAAPAETPQTTAAVTEAPVTEAPATEETTVTEAPETTATETSEDPANPTRGPDEETETESESETDGQAAPDLSTAAREEIVSYIESLGGMDSDKAKEYLAGLFEDDAMLVKIAVSGNTADVLKDQFGYDYDNKTDLEIARHIHRLSDEKLTAFVSAMTFEQYRRYLSIRKMMETMEEKDFDDVIDVPDFTPDRTFAYDSYDAFAEAVTGVSLTRTDKTTQFYNTYVDPSAVQQGVTTIDSLLDSNTDWYGNDYILGLNPTLSKETVPIYLGSDGNYYAVSAVPTVTGTESADFQPASDFYNGVVAEAYKDIQYLGNGVYRIPESRFQYCFTEQYVSDEGALFAVTFGLRIQTLYGMVPSGTQTIAADVLYPDGTDRILPAKLNLTENTVTVQCFADDYDDSLANYVISASVNKGEATPEGSAVTNDGKTLQLSLDDAASAGSVDIVIGYSAVSEYSSAPEVTADSLFAPTRMAKAMLRAASASAVSLVADRYILADQSWFPENLAVGDTFTYNSKALYMVGANTTTSTDGRVSRIGAIQTATHDAQDLCLYMRDGTQTAVTNWFITSLNNGAAAAPSSMYQMSVANINYRAGLNGTSVALGGARIFGYRSEALGSTTNAARKTLNLPGVEVLMACMHAWANESTARYNQVVAAINAFTGRSDRAADVGYGTFYPNIVLQCTQVADAGDGYVHVTFKVITSMLNVRGVYNPTNYQAAFSTLYLVYPKATKGYLKVHKTSTAPAVSVGSCYNFTGITYGLYTDAACTNKIGDLTLDASGNSGAVELDAGTYYVKETVNPATSGYATSTAVTAVTVTTSNMADAPAVAEVKDSPLNDPLGIMIQKKPANNDNSADLSGAQYTIKYYAGQYTFDTLPASADTTWVIQTTYNKSAGIYTARLNDEHIVSGSAVYGKYSTGTYNIPLGTVTVQETKAPAGFTMEGPMNTVSGTAVSGKDGVYLFNLTQKGDVVSLVQTNGISQDVTDEDAVTLIHSETPVPGIHTTALADDTKDHITKAAEEVSITDTVSYTGLTAGQEYTVQGTLMDKGTGKELMVDGKTVTAETAFTPASASGSVDLTFTFDGSALAGTSVVAFETLKQGDTEIAVHADLSDTDQTVEIPGIHTNAKDGTTGIDHTEAKAEASIVDTVSYTNLIPGKEYTVKGTLMDKATGEAVSVEGKAVTAETTFTPESASGTVDITFTLDASALAGTTVVAFESLEYQGIEVAVHADLTDEDQTVYIPGIHTTAVADDTKDHYTEAKKDLSITDTVSYTGLKVGQEYQVSGVLMDQKTGKELEVNGSTVTAEKSFTAEESSGTVDLTFTFDGSALAGTSLVAFETLTAEDREVAVHADIDDADQTVSLPGIHTTALADDTKDHITKAAGSVSITDTVSYTGLKPGTEYTVTGVLMEKTSGKELTADGKTVAAEAVFTPEESDGTVDITFTFDGSALAGTSVVAFETLKQGDTEVAVHADLKDTDQTVEIPKIHTDAKDKTTEIDHTEALPDAAIIDTVSYTNLLPGKTYTVQGTLMDKATGEAVEILGKKITSIRSFTPEAAEGTVDLTFTFNALALTGRTVVAFEKVSYKGIEVAVHADIQDENQTVYIPGVHTTALAGETKDHLAEAEKEVTITDEVRLYGLKVGQEYTVSGVLMDQETGKELTVNGNTVTAETTFTAADSAQTQTLTFTFDASALVGKSVVAFETLTAEGKEVGVHADLNDRGQTVSFPKIHTNAKDKTTEIDHTEALPEATIIDTVSYTNLLPGKEYTVKGTLMNKETGEAVTIDDQPITAQTTFTPDKPEGSVDITFTFDASVLAGTTVVAFESMEYQGIEVAVHADLSDENQTVYIPDIHTTALAEDTKDHVTKAAESVTITDTVSYSGLKPGQEYMVSGVLMDQETGEALLVKNEAVTSTATFTPESASGSVDLTFTFDASDLAGTTTVVFETLYTENQEVGIHADLSDEGQTVYLPKIHTNAKDGITGIDHAEAKAEATIIDTVTYTDLLPGKEYTVKGTLMNKETGEAVIIDDQPITAETTFTAEKSEGSVDITFQFDASALAGATVVAFESMEYKGIEVAVHADIRDEKQTVYIPEIHTTALADDTKDHITEAKAEASITDTVSYKGLKVGQEYIVSGVLMDKETGKALLVNGEAVVAQTTFTPEEKDGTVDVVFTFDASAIARKTAVVFETLYAENQEVAVHADIEDTDQTIVFPEAHTTATDKATGDHDGAVAETDTVLDDVIYKNLIPGKEYTVKGTLMVKSTGKALEINGTPVTAEKTFTAKEADGTVTLEFTFDSSALAGEEIVAFESVEYQGIEVAVHADLADENQTIHYPSMHTTAAAGDGGKTLALGNAAVLNDTVTYTGLTPGKTYVLKGEVMDKETGKTTGFTAETTFTAQTADGSAVVAFSVNTDGLEKHELVVFEDLYDTNGTLLLSHHDLSDTDQTVTVPEKPVIPPVVTGDNSTPMPMIAGLLVCLAVAAVILTAVIRRRKRNQ